MKKLFATVLCAFLFACKVYAREYFTITQYNVTINVNKDASLDVKETINLHFTEPRHGIYRFIPFKYPLQQLPAGVEKAKRQMESGGYAHIMIENIKVETWNYDVSTEGDYKTIKIGSADKLVDGDQQYVISYRVLNAINFFSDHTELYYNIIGTRWETTIDAVNFTINFYDAVPGTPDYFVATGANGSTENKTIAGWAYSKTFSGHTTAALQSNEGVTVGIVLPKDFLTEQNYNLLGIAWMILPLVVLGMMFTVWRKWGKDEKLTVQTEYYPPQNISPGIAGYIIDDVLNQRDLTSLIPYWGAGGYLQIKETEIKKLGIFKRKQYTFIKLKDLPANAYNFEKTLFNGIFATGKVVELEDLKNVLYKTMSSAKTQLESEIKRGDYYVKGSAETGCWFFAISIPVILYGAAVLLHFLPGYMWYGIALLASGGIIFFFAVYMRKKTPKGNTLFQKLVGFREFIQLVEKDRLALFLKEDEHYFDKVLPYAIVFGVADAWKDKLDGLNVPPPTWYVGNYPTFNAATFMNTLDNSMNEISKTFYSSPSSSGSSGGSFSSGGGFSGGGFGGGGGSSW